MANLILHKNYRLIPITYKDLQVIISNATGNKVGLAFSPTMPLKLLPAKANLHDLYEPLTNYLGLKGERVRNIIATVNHDLTNQPYIIIERIGE